VTVPLAGVAALFPLMWGWGLNWLDLLLGFSLYCITTIGIGCGNHRLFTHGSFTASKSMQRSLAVAGSLAIEGPLLVWVADHRRHHKYSDREGDPHSPWRYGPGFWDLTRGLLYAHTGWMIFNPNKTSPQKFAPDILADRTLMRISKAFPVWVVVSLSISPLVGGLASMSWHGAITAFFWGTLVRMFLMHHVTWSVNSVCHTFGNEDFEVRDKSRNVAWLAIPTFGESWHNLHHVDPTCARHGALKGQIDMNARLIRWAELAGWATDVRWPEASRLAGKQITPPGEEAKEIRPMPRAA
jgi:stearoyl-CoA desaturase (delta-9 desaturase)